MSKILVGTKVLCSLSNEAEALKVGLALGLAGIDNVKVVTNK